GPRLDERVVKSVEDHERRTDSRGLRGIEPGGGEGDVNAPRHLAFGRGGGRPDSDDRDHQDEHDREETPTGFHWGKSPFAPSPPRRGRGIQEGGPLLVEPDPGDGWRAIAVRAP